MTENTSASGGRQPPERSARVRRARRVTLAGVALCPGSIFVGRFWQAATGAWPNDSFPQGPFPVLTLAGLALLGIGTVMQVVAAVRRGPDGGRTGAPS